MIENLELTNVGPVSHLKVDLAPRVNILTGDNGLGKTFLLDLCWWVLTGGWVAKPALPKVADRPAAITSDNTSDVYVARSQQWEWDNLPRRCQSLVVYLRADGSAGVADPLLTKVRRDQPAHAELAGGPADRVPDALLFSTAQVWAGLPNGGAAATLCSGLLRDWVLWQLQSEASPEWQALASVLTNLSPPDDVLRLAKPQRVWLRDDTTYPMLETAYGAVPITLASDGVRRVLALAYLLVWSWSRHRENARLAGELPTAQLVLLIDELDAHLHPQWQRVILPALLRATAVLSPTLQVQIICTTHAPLVLASMEPHFDTERDALFTLDLDRTQTPPEVVIHKAEWRPRGKADRWLTAPAFGLTEPRAVEQEQAITAAMAALGQDDLGHDEVQRLHQLLAAALPPTDPIWRRWLAFAAPKGIEV